MFGHKLYKQIRSLGFGRHNASLLIRCENAKMWMSPGARFSSPLKNGLSPVLEGRITGNGRGAYTCAGSLKVMGHSLVCDCQIRAGVLHAW